ncbi:PREDICTED: LOB domain-containing protein 27 [Tarenaya hassleriana]|uniref:LOB domain-containing protein 27 n=1 Tax=Tarenaya hassleriana TaxID=28532 RepID=UPI00053C7EB9|nr:PREDICTED: LOB domain-containing protein 27 [Tarenaya hassleriana]
MTVKGGGTNGACAACKYQRRRCSSECPLAPYFPSEQPKLFHNVHRLFGVSSLVKILQRLPPSQRPEAMKSIIFQSLVRDRSPVHGCLGLTLQLQYLIWLSQQELRLVNARLHLFRQQQQQPRDAHPDNDHHHPSEDNHVSSQQQLDLGMVIPVKNSHACSSSSSSSYSSSASPPLPFFSPLPPPQQQQQVSYFNSCSDVNGYSSAENIPNTYNPYGGFCHYNGDDQRNNVTTIQSQHLNPEIVSQDYDEIHQFFDIIDDRQSFVEETKEAYASSSSEGSLKGTTTQPLEHVGENELRSAATRFSLTSVN